MSLGRYLLLAYRKSLRWESGFYNETILRELDVGECDVRTGGLPPKFFLEAGVVHRRFSTIFSMWNVKNQLKEIIKGK